MEVGAIQLTSRPLIQQYLYSFFAARITNSVFTTFIFIGNKNTRKKESYNTTFLCLFFLKRFFLL